MNTVSLSLGFYIVHRPQGIRKQMKTLRKQMKSYENKWKRYENDTVHAHSHSPFKKEKPSPFYTRSARTTTSKFRRSTEQINQWKFYSL